MVSRAVFIDGIRTPFQLPHTGYRDMTGAVLLSSAIRRLLSRVKVDKPDIDFMVAGNVFHEVKSPNIASVAATQAGLPIPANSLSMACISGQAAIGKAVNMVNAGHADLVLVGGAEYLTDFPVRVNEKVRKLRLKLQNSELSRKEKLALMSQLRPKDWIPDVLKVVEFQTQETFIKNGDRLASRFGISRSDQDDYGYRSHRLSNHAASEGKFSKFMCSVDNPNTHKTIMSDGTLKKWDRGKMGKLWPVRRSSRSTVTIATANQPCDGAAVCLIASERAAEKHNLTPRGLLSPVSYAGCSPHRDLLLGTTCSLARLKRSQPGLQLEEADVVELYEGFAGEVLSQLAALRCPQFAREYLNLDSFVGDIDPANVNKWGGTIGLGHPFGATGIRLLLHAVGRLEEEQGKLGLVAGCAGGGLGAAFSVTRI